MASMLDWISSALTLLAIYLLGKPKTAVKGWVTGTLGGILWVAYAVITGQDALFLLNAALIIMYVRGWMDATRS